MHIALLALHGQRALLRGFRRECFGHQLELLHRTEPAEHPAKHDSHIGQQDCANRWIQRLRAGLVADQNNFVQQ